ncbi:MAG: PASTA domain-containing protein [bacterium]|nr:PASTA domain-containing protein [bacterium]
MPDVVGLLETDARAALAEVGLEMTVTDTYFSRSDIGKVRSQWPEPGSGARTGSEIMVGVAVFPGCAEWEEDTPAPSTGEIQVTVLFICAADSGFPDHWTTLTRNAPAADSEIEVALRSLLDGPNAVEQAAGFGSFFSGDGDALNWVTFDGGRLIVDFNDGILVNNASTSNGSIFFMAELRANLFQFENIVTIQFQIDSRCGALDEFIQMGPDCRDWTRTEWNRDLADWKAANG